MTRERLDRPDLVKACGIPQARLARAGTWAALLVFLLTVGATALATVGQGTDTVARAVTTAMTFVALTVAIWQWRNVRHEGAIDKFYERLHLSNQMRLNAAEAAFTMREAQAAQVPDGQPEHLFVLDGSGTYCELAVNFYVYTELDNLEYVVHKYRHGYISRDMANRALHNFQTRFRMPGFEEHLKKLYGVGSYTELPDNYVKELWMLWTKQQFQDQHRLV